MSKFTKTVIVAGSLYAAYELGRMKGYMEGMLNLLKAQKEKEKRDKKKKEESLKTKINDVSGDLDRFAKLIDELIKENTNGNKTFN